jgi:hypothetical protein
MQLGSGTWDVLPSATVHGRWQRLSWGAQVGGAWRPQHENRDGYALGDALEVSGWTGVALWRGFSLSTRVLFTWQDEIRGQFDRLHESSSPVDFPRNYGGRFWDFGAGVSWRIPAGRFAGNRVAVEWLEPIAQDPNGFQLEREGSLALTWGVDF